MTARRRAIASALAAVLASLGTRPVTALERSCPSPSVEADASFRARFPGLLEQLRRELDRPDVDGCARVYLRSDDDVVTAISVTLADGRAATRTALRSDDILPAVQALLLVPITSEVQASSAPAEPATARQSVVAPKPAPGRVRTWLPDPRVHDQTAEADPEARRLGFELSLVGGPRFGGGQLAVGLGALSFVEVHGFVFGFQSRVDRYQTLLDGDAEMALELALLAGKRVHLAGVALDFTAGPAVAMKGLAFSSTETVAVSHDVAMQSAAAPPPFPEEPTTGAVPRLLLGARAGFTPRDVLRTFAGVEASIWPESADRDEAARFPALIVGLVVGGTVGTR